ncbi:hypothetical protein Tco_1209290 [Tanacetum coccineum]
MFLLDYNHQYQHQLGHVLSPSTNCLSIRLLCYQASEVQADSSEAASTSNLLTNYTNPSYSLTPDQMHHHQGHHLCIYSLLTVEQTDLRLSYHLEREHMTEFETRVWQDTNMIYTRLDDEQTKRQLLAVLARQSEIRELQAADRKRQTVITEMLAADHKRQAMINQGVTVALAARDANKSTNGDDSHNSGTGVRRTERAARECTYTDFLKCQPLNFKGTEGVTGLSQWFERMESVFHISNCIVENQVKTVGHDAAYGMP